MLNPRTNCFSINELDSLGLIASPSSIRGVSSPQYSQTLKEKESTLTQAEFEKLQQHIDLALRTWRKSLLKSRAESTSAAPSKSETISMTRSDFQSLVDEMDSLRGLIRVSEQLASEYSDNLSLKQNLSSASWLSNQISEKLRQRLVKT